jgi:hypothetical protein
MTRKRVLSFALRLLFVWVAMSFCVACGETTLDKTKLETLVGDPLNPDLYRAQIVAIDAILFEDGPLGAADRDELIKSLAALEEATSKDPANNKAVSQLSQGKNLHILIDVVKGTRVGTPRLNSQVRERWMRVRFGLFDDAAWFRRSSADPIEPTTSPAR